jgi:hypothetical protein
MSAMATPLWRLLLITLLALLMLGCALIPDVGRLLRDADAAIPLTTIGGIPVRVEATVEFDNREVFAGAELESSSGAWTHIQEGRLLRTVGWQPHLDEVESAHGGGRYVCYYDWGEGGDPATPHWTVSWSGDLTFDEPGGGGARPLIHLAVYGDDVLVLYAPPHGFSHWHPGSPDDCQNPDPVPAHEADATLSFPLDDVDVARAPDAATSTLTAVQEGVVLLSVPLDRLRSGTSETGSVSLSGVDEGYYGKTEWALHISLSLTSSPGDS